MEKYFDGNLGSRSQRVFGATFWNLDRLIFVGKRAEGSTAVLLARLTFTVLVVIPEELVTVEAGDLVSGFHVT